MSRNLSPSSRHFLVCSSSSVTEALVSYIFGYNDSNIMVLAESNFASVFSPGYSVGLCISTWEIIVIVIILYTKGEP